MNKVKKLVVKSFLVSCFIIIFSLSVYATETPTEEPVTEAPAVEEPIVEEPAPVEPITSFISVDLGFELLLTVDENGMILEVEAMTEAGTLFLEGQEIIDVTVTDGIQSLLDASPESTEVSLFVISEDQTLINTLSESLVSSFGEVVEGYEPGVEDPTIEDPSTEDPSMEDQNPIIERFNLAKELGVSPGKMNLIQKLEKSFSENVNIDYTNWAEKSVKEIMKTIKDNRKYRIENAQDEAENDFTEIEASDDDEIEKIDVDEEEPQAINAAEEEQEIEANEEESQEKSETNVKEQKNAKVVKSRKNNGNIKSK